MLIRGVIFRWWERKKGGPKVSIGAAQKADPNMSLLSKYLGLLPRARFSPLGKIERKSDHNTINTHLSSQNMSQGFSELTTKGWGETCENKPQISV